MMCWDPCERQRKPREGAKPEKDSESQKEGNEMRSYDRKRTESREMKNKGKIRFGDAFDSFSVQKENCGQIC
jgi:hypothetical protein